MSTAKLYSTYKTKMQKIADVKYASAVLQWDQETYLPPKGNDFRGQQIATLSEIAHQLFTDKTMGELLEELDSCEDLSLSEKRNIELSKEDYKRNIKLSAAFVRQMSETVNQSYHAWAKARKENSFSLFEQPLHELIQLKKQEADMLGYDQHPYNALMNDYDKGLTVSKVDSLFNELKTPLLNLLDSLKNKKSIDNSFLFQEFKKDNQWEFGLEILKRIGFDFEAGRQDISLHPFTTNFSSKDVRVTTRIDEHDFSNMTWSCLHEGGHALYEQGLPADQYGLPLGEYCSLSIHESQSRLWENCIGRGLLFWQHNFKLLTNAFPKQLKDINIEKFYKGINVVSPSLIRTEADELTYHFHVMIRYEIEKMLIEGSLATKDIPACWNEMYQKYLGIKVPDDNRGCLQDIHWSHGSFGYFATYSLGSLYAAQFYSTIEKKYPTVSEDLINGEINRIQDWLKKEIYCNGRYYSSEELCKKATGETLQSSHFIDYATKKFSGIYL
jgi:carboxypeptidase Taq